MTRWTGVDGHRFFGHIPWANSVGDNLTRARQLLMLLSPMVDGVVESSRLAARARFTLHWLPDSPA